MSSKFMKEFEEAVEKTYAQCLSFIRKKYFIDQGGGLHSVRYGQSAEDIYQEAYLSTLKFLDSIDRDSSVFMEVFVYNSICRHAEWKFVEFKNKYNSQKDRDERWSSLNTVEFDSSIEEAEVSNFIRGCEPLESMFLNQKIRGTSDSDIIKSIGANQIGIVKSRLKKKYRKLK